MREVRATTWIHHQSEVGFGGLTVMMTIGALLDSVAGILCGLVGYTIVLLFTWPALEALVSENETQEGVQHNVGIYNCTWASAGAVAYFLGGRLYDWLGHTAVFWIPAGIFLIEFLIVIWLGKQKVSGARDRVSDEERAHAPEELASHQGVPPKTFLKMAWLANPFAYVGINTVIAVMPGVANHLGLSPTRVGLFCSVWWFARLGTFALLWQWRGWHYRFRWMLTAFVLLIGSFMLLLLAGQLWLVVLAQVFFGFAVD